MIDRTALRLSAVLLVVGFIFYVVVGLLHAGGPPILMLAWITWLVVVAWQTKESSRAPTA
jgi:hypothetical protein